MVLGMLLAFVLAFGVQGTADAVVYTEVQESTLISAELYTINDPDNNTISGPNLSFTQDDDDRIEKVTITISSGILLTTPEEYGERTVTLTESTVNGNIPGLNVQGRFLTAGKQTIEISGTDYDKEADDPSFSGRWKLTYIYYVTQPAPNTATINLANLRNGYKAEVYRDISIYGGDSKYYAVTYASNVGALTYKIPGLTADINVTGAAISSAFKVSLTGDTDSNVITATVTGSKLSTTGAYFYGQPVLTETGPTGEGTVNALLKDAFTATVAGGDASTGLAGILVKFEVNDKTSAGGNLVFTQGNGEGGILVDPSNKQILDAGGNVQMMGGGKTLYIRTGSAGAKVDFRLGTAAEQKVTISAVGKRKEVSAFTNVSANYELSLDEIQDISGKYGLYVLAEKAGEPLELGWDVVFTTAHGEFEGTGTLGTDREDTNFDFTVPTDGDRKIVQHTNEQGIAYVIFDPKGSSGPLEVTASIKDDENYEGDDAITVAQLTFDALSGTGGGSRGGGGGGGGGGGVDDDEDEEEEEEEEETETLPGSLSIDVTGTGATRSVTVTAASAQNRNVIGLDVRLRGTALPGGQQTVRSGAATPITLPTAAGDYTLEAAASGFATVTENIRVTAGVSPALPASSQVGTLTVSKDGAQAGTQQPILVQATPAPSRNLAFTVTRGGFSVGYRCNTDDGDRNGNRYGSRDRALCVDGEC